ncbi:amidohydrolase/deacetylase family metallohydrolase [Paenibacillus sp. GCM10012307]|uniref:Amidohydrolase/deacetylase family metallohydrolase n=1 Tax=Paenibacillus roseus TaxID=2798579 RepID=A0A934J5I9_9BACL|nr:amidohydrolase/deacetylase family metallohydrolase [Paenibacillus roseus]MBJ6361176.1 amidohydrolase/deacetylase family metallohydrolase [Paenibacillus roseus]
MVDITFAGERISGIVPAGIGEGNTLWDGVGSETYVSSGWIDMHVHAMSELHPYGDEIDEIGIKQGVTTIVDAGSCGADRIAELYEAGKDSDTRLLAFLNISRIGLERVDELSRLEWLDEALVRQATRQYPEFIVGLKARMSRSVVKEQGIEPLEIARKLSGGAGLPLMVHIGSAPPAIQEVLRLLEQGDIVTHYLNGKPNNVFGADGQPLPELLDAIARGVHLDVGHGTASFSFHIAEKAKLAGIPLHTISTDIYRGNRLNGPVYSMSAVLTKFLHLGYSLGEVIRAVTVNAAAWLGRPELAEILVGSPADLTVFTVEQGEQVLMDSEGAKRTAERIIQPKGVVRNGSFIAC